MFRLLGAGPTAIEPVPGGEPGDRLIRVQAGQDIVVELMFGPEFIEQYVVPRLTMGDTELVEKLEAEREEVEQAEEAARTRQKIHIPGRPS